MLTTNRLRELLSAYTWDELQDMFSHKLKKRPADRDARGMLATLWCVEGKWDKALIQADILRTTDEGESRDGELLKNLILSEMVREKVLAGERVVSTLDGASVEWMDRLQQANTAAAKGDEKEADRLRGEAFDLASITPGEGEKAGKFNWIADGDGRLGPVCEFICAGGYRWVPFEQIQSLKTRAPANLTDLLWLPAVITVAQRSWHGYLPARYPVIENATLACKLGDETHWNPQTELLTTGSGRKMWITDTQDFSVMEMGELEFSGGVEHG
ncbi:ImpE family T6SS protein Cts1E [Enterobacteriaceae bacterium RIT714]|nr:ImpE family T6SS protein Cts1E [Enterobacteriaceae bacterium RIT714]